MYTYSKNRNRTNVNQTKTFIVVVTAMLCIAGACSYFFQEVLDEQSAFVAADAYTLPAQQAKSNMVSTPIAHDFWSAPAYTPAGVHTPVVRSTGQTYSLPTYSGSKMQSYGASVHAPMASTIVAPAVPMATQATPTPTVHVNPLAHRTNAVQPTNMTPRRNRMLATGRAEAMGNYSDVMRGDNVNGTPGLGGPMKAPGTLEPGLGTGDESTWGDWLSEYLAHSGLASVGEDDMAAMQSWWNGIYGGGGYAPNTWETFWYWVMNKDNVPLTDGVWALLFFLVGYLVYKKRILITK